MIVQVAGLERFVGDIKRCYQAPSQVYADVERHHTDFHAAHGGTLVEQAIKAPNDLPGYVAQLEADPRTMWGDFIRMTDGNVSCRLYENPVPLGTGNGSP